jgi:hypothetical protein
MKASWFSDEQALYIVSVVSALGGPLWTAREGGAREAIWKT